MRRQFLAEFDAKALEVGLYVGHATQPYFDQGLYRNLTVVFQSFPEQSYFFIQTSQGILFIFMVTKTLQKWLLNTEISYSVYVYSKY